jgi:WD40 repeat protein
MLKGQDDVVRSVVLTPDGKLLFSCGDAGIVQIWDLSSGRLERCLNTKSHPVFSIVVTPDGNRIVSGGSDNSVRVWDLASEVLMWDLSTGQEVASWNPDPDAEVTAVCTVPTDPTRIAYGDSAGRYQVLQLLES